MTGRVVIIPHRISGPIWLSEHVGISEAAEQRQFETAWSGPNDDGSLDQQSEILEQAIRDRVEGVILSPNVYQVFRRDVRMASDRHIPIVLEDVAARIEPMAGVSFVLSNQDETGRLAAKRLGEILSHRGKILIVGLDPHIPGNVERSDAIVAALEKFEPGINVSDRVIGSSSPAHSEMMILDAIKAHPNTGALMSLSAGESIAAASALRSSGKLKDIKIIGCDQSQSVFMLLRLGVLDSLIIQNNRRMGRLAIETISDMKNHLYESRTLYVDPVLVTRDNIETEPVQQLLLMHR